MTEPPALTWSLHELRTGRQIGVLDEVLPGSWVDVEPAGRKTAWLSLSTEDPHANDIYPLGVVLRAWQGQVPIFAGVLQQPTVNGAEGTIEVPALGPRGRLEAFQVGMRSGTPGFPGHATDLPFRWEQLPQGEIMRRLVAYADPTVDEVAAGIPGHGIVDGQIVPGQPRDREYDPGKAIAEALDELGNVAGGPDWDLATIWDATRPWALARLDVLPTIGIDRRDDVILDHQIGLQNASNLKWMPGGDDGGPAVNRFLGVGEAPRYDGDADQAPLPPSFVGNQVDSQVAFGLYTRYEAFPGVTEPANVAGQVSAVLATSSFPVDHFEVTPAPGALHFSPVGDLWLGDLFRARGQSGNVEMDLEGRASGARITVIDETGATDVAIRAAPRQNRAVST